MARPDDGGNITCTGCTRTLPGTVKYFHRHRDAFKPKCKECRGTSFGVQEPNKVLDVPDGKKICNECRQLFPATVEYFHRNRDSGDDLMGKCKECRGSDFGVHRPNKVHDIPDGHWMCSSCSQVLPLNGRYFYETSDGFEVHCKACSTQRRNQTRRAAREQATDDLTGRQWNFIKALWLDGGIVTCAYCGDPTEDPERDHVQPLSDAGDTVPENVVPVCSSCNRSKHGKLVTEWYPDSDGFTADRWERIQAHLRGDTQIPR